MLPQLGFLADYALDTTLAIVAFVGWSKYFALRKEAEKEVAFLESTVGVWRQRAEKRAAFTTLGTLMLMAGMSLPAIAMVASLRSSVGVNAVVGIVWAASAVGIALAIAGNHLSKEKRNPCDGQ